MNEWQPIEKAPKDGTPILGVNIDDEKSLPYVMCWDDYRGKWIEADGEGFMDFNPTHYMKVPEKPNKNVTIVTK